MRDDLFDLRDNLKKLIPLFDRLSYERREASIAASNGLHAVKNLLYLSKAREMHAEDFEGVEKFLSGFGDTERGNCAYRELMILVEFCVKYISDTEVTEGVSLFLITKIFFD